MPLPKLIFFLKKAPGNQLVLIALSLVMAFFFFPFPVSVIANGVDPPLSWVFTYLMQGRIALGKEIIFPHGPLAFIMYPLPGDALWWVAISFTIVVRFAWAYGFLALVVKKSAWYLPVAFAGSLLLSGYVALLLAMVQLVILCFLNYLDYRKLIWLIPPLILTALAFFVKAFVGILCLSVVFPFFLILLYLVLTKQENRWKLSYFLFVPVSIIAIWYALYGTYHGLLRYMIGMQQLAADNSAAVALYPHNLWLLLTIGILAGLVLIIMNLRNRKLLFYYFLSGPALFAIWKYGMAREDYLHASVLMVFLLFVVFTFHLVVEKFRIYHLALSVIILGTFYLNLRKSYYFETFVPDTSGFAKLLAAASHYGHFSDTCSQASAKNIERNKFDSNIRALIGNQTVDIYPWDFTYAAANNLNFQPRPVLQSYASYTKLLDNLNARHFEGKSAPEFIIWELQKITRDIHGGKMESIDGRYLLNDEPDVMVALLANYQLVARQEGTFPVLVYRKRPVRQKLVTNDIATVLTGWNTWIDVPDKLNGLLRASVHTRRNLIGRMNGLLYKDNAVYAYYLLSNGDIRQYRVVPRTIDYGLWLNPLIMNPELQLEEPRVVKICFRSLNDMLMKEKIWVTFTQTYPADIAIQGDDSSGFVHSFFDTRKDRHRTTLLQVKFDLTSALKEWSNVASGSGMQLQGRNLMKVNPEGYSAAFSYNLDSLACPQGYSAGIIRSQVWVKTKASARAALIISIEKDGKSIDWKPIDIHHFIFDENDFNLVTGFMDIEESWKNEKGLTLKIYLWNNGKLPVELDGFSVRIEGVLPETDSCSQYSAKAYNQ